MSTKEALIIFIRNPELGKVKTRLAQRLGDEKTLQIYEALLGHTRKIALRLNVSRWLFYSHFIDSKDNWSNEAFTKRLQIEGDLGQKIRSGFEQAFQEHDKVLIIGSDCASLTAQIVQDGFDALDRDDFVLGPALDGGYYLLGMRQYTASLFEDIPWSTEEVAKLTLAKIEAMGASCHLLPALSDIDYAEDWEKYGWEL